MSLHVASHAALTYDLEELPLRILDSGRRIDQHEENGRISQGGRRVLLRRARNDHIVSVDRSAAGGTIDAHCALDDEGNFVSGAGPKALGGTSDTRTNSD